ncbi:DEHA2B01936p [Debaryomyces hansenii CBS767]|uniref:Glutamyl-tRNA(Gln) amidotransferase subunit F, mitochondrial n=1 Tax=Debaryomyces hansenii (strain ATCC 36239 / CBS 767 / BCRC 21394 / JCM 1990 / NBRC 0083 / IGC 2968) TaxID=284592 RepID=GATF_DEBHA|nr:DEHA2B01936p [Debaryomyces hansenii CBS767]Q6BXL8.2 RecName: Full=Glutamyl-tRNA(Gln) amidotransferase subunit F, mitochondrial; Short=Glu-AdT subunit F; Flags: Precursor [Debaryomyces hansenii CBS767]CAG85037.2 DEHA2B01936p [Debaryomyces hansenii CBS767]|eukprot:XP_457051.2 DEHA2B01936p [Debaryomyces hansenii CBS767]
MSRMLNQIPRLITRSFRTSSVGYKATLGPILENKSQIQDLVNKSEWNIVDIIKFSEDEVRNIKIDSRVITKMLRASGLKDSLSEDQKKSLIRGLKLQMIFIKYLYEGDEAEFHKIEESNDDVFRLILSDHKAPKPITLKSLLSSIENLENEVDAEKGEIKSSLDISKLNGNNPTYFTVRSNKE